MNAVRLDLPSIAGRLGAAYAIPILYVPLLAFTHLAAVLLLVDAIRRPRRAPAFPIAQGQG